MILDDIPLLDFQLSRVLEPPPAHAETYFCIKFEYVFNNSIITFVILLVKFPIFEENVPLPLVLKKIQRRIINIKMDGLYGLF